MFEIIWETSLSVICLEQQSHLKSGPPLEPEEIKAQSKPANHNVTSNVLHSNVQHSHSGGLHAFVSFSLPPFHPPHLLFLLYLFDNSPLRDSSIESDFATSLKGHPQCFCQVHRLNPAYTRLYINKILLKEQHPEHWTQSHAHSK